MVKRTIVLVLVVTALLSFTVNAKTSSRLITGAEIPEFELVGDQPEMLWIGPGELYFNATIINNGTPATAGTVPISWEEVVFDIDFEPGWGTLVESEAGVEGMDLNGDGDQADTFEVTWDGNDNRPLDVNITDGTAEIHAYALYEADWMNYSINGQSKVFQLGSRNHTVYGGLPDAGLAQFGLNAFIMAHPSPCFQFAVYSADFDAIENLTAGNFKINGQTAELNSSISLIEELLETSPSKTKCYVVSSPGLEIASGEQVTFSCTIKGTSNANFSMGFLANWSPDGIQRYKYHIAVGLTPPSTTTSPSTGEPVPGFSFAASAALAVPVILAGYRRKRD